MSKETDRIKELIKDKDMEDGTKILIAEKLCVSKSQARRMYIQLREVKNEDN